MWRFYCFANKHLVISGKLNLNKKSFVTAVMAFFYGHGRNTKYIFTVTVKNLKKNKYLTFISSK